MNLKLCTITGADDSVSVPRLVDLSEKYPFVEWGILVSARQEGSYRFPSRHWIDRFAAVAQKNKLNVSTHLCGLWVRQLMIGELDWLQVPACFDVSQRVQVNTHGEAQVSTQAMMGTLIEKDHKQFLFQWDGVNDHLTYAVHAYGLSVGALHDASGGAGVLPSKWPVPTSPFWCGYAGGLGPENVWPELLKIAEVVKEKPFWIDMERRVRTPDDSALDLAKVESVLRQVEPYVTARELKPERRQVARTE